MRSLTRRNHNHDGDESLVIRSIRPDDTKAVKDIAASRNVFLIDDDIDKQRLSRKNVCEVAELGHKIVGSYALDFDPLCATVKWFAVSPEIKEDRKTEVVQKLITSMKNIASSRRSHEIVLAPDKVDDATENDLKEAGFKPSAATRALCFDMDDFEPAVKHRR